jgi:Cu2+-exporting ATPase
VARTDFDASTIATLLRSGQRRDGDRARATPWWTRLTSLYVGVVVAIAGATFAAWLAFTHDVARTLDVVAAVLIVTCPCAFGIATPLAYELAQAALRKVGLFVRTPGFLDRANEVRRVVFDKTGTLTTGSLVVENPSALTRLAAEERQVAYELAVRSSHPRSRAIALALSALGVTGFDGRRDVREIAGKGMQLEEGAHVWRLGAPGWAATALADRDVVFARDGKVLAALTLREELRPDVTSEIRALEREGYELYILSGDSAEATEATADACGIPRGHAYGARTPEAKARWLERLGADAALFVGDGINDSLVASSARCAGTPAIDRPFMAARCDFYFTSPGLRPVRAALEMSQKLASVVRTNLAIAVVYNVLTVSLAVSGLMTPLLCAVLMPASSVSTVLATTFRLRRATWTS